MSVEWLHWLGTAALLAALGLPVLLFTTWALVYTAVTAVLQAKRTFTRHEKLREEHDGQ